MKRITTIFFLTIIVITSLKGYFPYLEYTFNKDYISKILCINIDKPELNCEGKCHLKSQLKKYNPESNKDYPSPLTKNKIKTVLFIQKIAQYNFVTMNLNNTFKNEYTSHFFIQPYIEIPTPPPKVLFNIR